MRSQQLDTPFFGHDREELTRILLQSLSDLGYHGTARQLSSESGYELESPSVAAFRDAVVQGEWEEAEALLLGSEAQTPVDEGGGGVMLYNGHANGRKRSSAHVRGGSVSNGFARHGLPLAEGADTVTLKFMLREQKYLELLESRNLNTALHVLRNELTPLKKDMARLHALSSLMMCHSAADLRLQSSWDGAQGSSRSTLLSQLSTSISPSVMIPSHRLATLLTSVQDAQSLSCRHHNTTAQPSLYTDHLCAEDDFPLHALTALRHHSDEVWHLAFSPSGSLLATAGKDGLVCVYDTSTWRLRHEFREHEPRVAAAPGAAEVPKGVCYIAFSPDEHFLISCSQANEFVVVAMMDGRRVGVGDHFVYPVTCAAWLPDSCEFVVGTQDSRRPLGLYSLWGGGYEEDRSVMRNYEIHSFREPAWDPALKDNPSSWRIASCDVSADGQRLAAATIDNHVMLFDLPGRTKIASWAMEDRITSLSFGVPSRRGGAEQILLNLNKGQVLTLDAVSGEMIMGFEGVSQKEFVIRSCFGGAGDNFVVSGSEDGRVLIWRRQTGDLVAECIGGHTGVGAVNAVAWMPGPGGREGGIWASAGDDRGVVVYVPTPLVSRQGWGCD